MMKTLFSFIRVIFFVVVSVLADSFLFVNNVYSQEYTSEELDSLTVLADSCSVKNFSAMQQLAYYYYNKNNITSYKNIIQKQLACGDSLDNKKILINAYYGLLNYHFNNVEEDSVLFVASKIKELAESSPEVSLQRISMSIDVDVGKFYYKHLDDLELGYKYFRDVKEKAYKKQCFGAYLSAVNGLVNYYSDDEEYHKAIALVDEALSKLPDHNNTINDSFYSKTYMPIFIDELEVLKKNRAVSILYDDHRDSLEIWNAYYELRDIAIKYRDIHPIYSIEMLQVVLDRMDSYLSVDSLIYYSGIAMNTVNKYGFKNHYIYRLYANNLIRTGQYDKAKLLLDTALVVALSGVDYFYEIAQTYYQYSKIDLAKGNAEEALSNFDLYRVYQDSSYNRRKGNALETLESRYNLRQTEVENQRMAQESNLLSQRLNLFRVIGFLLSSLLLLGLYFYSKIRKNKLELERINDGKNRLFGIIAHDLRGPAAAFSEIGESVHYLVKNNQTERLLELSEYYDRAGKRLSYTLTNLLDWAISQKDNFIHNPRPLNVKTEVDEIIADLEFNIAKKDLKIENNISKESSFYFDKNAFKVIVRNLLHNSIKFSNRNTRVVIDISEQGLTIKDAGIGIDAATLKKLHSEHLVMSREGTANEKGSGIGITTCMKLAVRNNSSIKFTSKVGLGTTAILTYPN